MIIQDRKGKGPGAAHAQEGRVSGWIRRHFSSTSLEEKKANDYLSALKEFRQKGVAEDRGKMLDCTKWLGDLVKSRKIPNMEDYAISELGELMRSKSETELRRHVQSVLCEIAMERCEHPSIPSRILRDMAAVFSNQEEDPELREYALSGTLEIFRHSGFAPRSSQELLETISALGKMLTESKGEVYSFLSMMSLEMLFERATEAKPRNEHLMSRILYTFIEVKDEVKLPMVQGSISKFLENAVKAEEGKTK